ncbi:translation initiation factor IF-2-like [Gopherus flavomarginatus]|uniref:translation initiation factor IF-2-like n=1 Tax=Gopherus flavomarginatus TaxID=286002 RepID=UPI0021CBAC94|nr:translation initiation factor IF-2-like [Gopherus flavomarginatus]
MHRLPGFSTPDGAAPQAPRRLPAGPGRAPSPRRRLRFVSQPAGLPADTHPVTRRPRLPGAQGGRARRAPQRPRCSRRRLLPGSGLRSSSSAGDMVPLNPPPPRGPSQSRCCRCLRRFGRSPAPLPAAAPERVTERATAQPPPSWKRQGGQVPGPRPGLSRPAAAMLGEAKESFAKSMASLRAALLDYVTRSMTVRAPTILGDTSQTDPGKPRPIVVAQAICVTEQRRLFSTAILEEAREAKTSPRISFILAGRGFFPPEGITGLRYTTICATTTNTTEGQPKRRADDTKENTAISC